MEKHYFNIVESGDQVTIEVYGIIGESWWDEGVTFKSVSDQLKEIAAGSKKVLVKINSYGGDVNDALAIFETLRSMGDRVTTECVGFCASAATIIAMAGSVRRMSSYGLFLIHKCSSGAWGNENEVEAELEAQRKVNECMIKVYEDVTGCKREKLEALMNENNGNGIWLNVDEAIEYGFITEAIPDTKEDKKKKAFYENMFKKLFTNHQKFSDMKKSIIAFAALAALLAMNEVEAKDNKALFDDDQLKKLNDALTNAETAKVNAETAKTAAETAKAESENKLAAAETEKANLQTKVKELQAIIDKTPAQETPKGGSDNHTDDGQESFEDWYAKQPHVIDAKRELGL